MIGGGGYRPVQFHDLQEEFAVFRIGFRRALLIFFLLGGALPGTGVAQQAEGPTLEALIEDEARAREAASAAWDAAEAADEARDTAAATLERLQAEAVAARETAQEAIATLSLAIGRRQAEEARLEAADDGDEAAELAEAEAARLAAEEEVARLAAEEEAARVAAEEEAARVAAEEEAARLPRRKRPHALPRGRSGARVAAEEEAARLAAEEEAARIAAEQEAARLARGRGRPRSLRRRCRPAFGHGADLGGCAARDLPRPWQARADCTEAARDLPEAGAALFHLATIAQATGEHRQAVRLYERSAEAGEVAALTRLGDYYNFGIRPVREDVAAGGGALRRGRGRRRSGRRRDAGDDAPAGPGRSARPRAHDRADAQGADAGYHFAQYRLAQTLPDGGGRAR
jgi:hypothetical protein